MAKYFKLTLIVLAQNVQSKASSIGQLEKELLKKINFFLILLNSVSLLYGRAALAVRSILEAKCNDFLLLDNPK